MTKESVESDDDEIMTKIRDFYNQIKDFEYGFHGTDNRRHVDKETDIDGIFNKYRTMRPSTIYDKKCYVCWDAVRIEAEWFKKNLPSIPIKCYYIEYAPPKCNNHTWLTFKYKNSWYIFEVSWKRRQGITKIEKGDGISDYVSNMSDNPSDKYVVFEYDPLAEPYGLTLNEFMSRKWSNGKRVKTNVSSSKEMDELFSSYK